MLCVDDQVFARPGIFVESRVRPRVSGVLCVTLHGGTYANATITRTGAQTALVAIPATITFWAGFYSENVLARGFQPHDQPAATAHMPLPFSAFERHNFDAWTLFVERRARTEPMRRLVVDDARQRRFRGFAFEDAALFAEEVAAFFDAAGVAASVRTRAGDRIIAAYRRAASDEALSIVAPPPPSRTMRVAPSPASVPPGPLALAMAASGTRDVASR